MVALFFDETTQELPPFHWRTFHGLLTSELHPTLMVRVNVRPAWNVSSSAKVPVMVCLPGVDVSSLLQVTATFFAAASPVFTVTSEGNETLSPRLTVSGNPSSVTVQYGALSIFAPPWLSQ